MANLLTDDVNGAVYDGTAHNANNTLIEATFENLGPFVISGLTVSAGIGLAVTVAAGVAVIGGRVTKSGSFSIGGLTDNTTNYLYLLQNGTTTANTTGTDPSLSVRLGTCVTAGGAVSSVDTNRSSGRQLKVRTENLVLGGPGAGNPGSQNLASWNATAGNGFSFYGVLPAGAVPASSTTLAGLTDVTLTSVARGDTLYRGASKWNNLAAGTSGQFLKTQGAGADPVWSGLSTSDLAPAVILAPLTGARNVVQSSGDFVKFEVLGNAFIGQTQDIARLWNGSVGLTINAEGVPVLVSSSAIADDILICRDTNIGATAFGVFTAGNGVSVRCRALDVNDYALRVRGFTAQVAPILSVQTDGGATNVFEVGPNTIGFYGATPVAQISGSTDVLAGLVTQGLRAASSNPPLNLGTGALTCGAISGTSITVPGAGSGSEKFGASALAAGFSGTSLGNTASASGQQGTAIGAGSLSSGNFSTAIGQAAQTTNSYASALGQNAQATSDATIAIGVSSAAAFSTSIALGVASSTTAANQIVAGQNTYYYSNVFIGSGVTDTTPKAITLNASGGSGTNIAGASLTLAGGKGTGSAVGGDIIFSSTIAGSSGTTLNSLQEKFRISQVGVLTATQRTSTSDRSAFDITPTWATSTDASRKARVVFNIWDTAVREAFRIEADGSTPMIGFLGASAVARPSAYTQTYATATRTHANVTSSSVSTTASTQTTPWGYASQAQADAIPVAINAVAADLLNLKQLVNSLIDDGQAFGLLA